MLALRGLSGPLRAEITALDLLLSLHKWSPVLRGSWVRTRGKGPKALVVWAAPGIVGPMARPLPLLRARGVLALALACACNSDEPLDTTTTVPPDTDEAMTEGKPFTTVPPENTSTGEPEDPETTCRQAEQCLVDCYMALPTENNDPEQDFSCFFDCGEGMTTEEWLALIDLGDCIYRKCFSEMKCSEHGENDDMMCRDCIILGLFANNPYPAGCEAEAMACK